MKRRFVVYTLARPNGHIFYVGKGPRRRTADHIREAKSGECYCRKCKIIHEILRSGREVKIDYIFETDDGREALAKEAETIKALSTQYHLCNKMGNIHYTDGPRPAKLFSEMTFDELNMYLDTLSIAKAERQKRIQEWAGFRLDHLDRYMRLARLQQRRDDAERMKEEAESIRVMMGRFRQFELGL